MSNLTYQYKKISFDELLCYECDVNDGGLYENSIYWLTATHQWLFNSNTTVSVHCLFDQEKLLCALPLVSSVKYSLKELRCLTSFYANSISPLYFAKHTSVEHVKTLINEIIANTPWHQFRLGPVEFDGELANVFKEFFPAQFVFSESKNWYIDELTDFESFYQQRPSKLKNTIKRQEKKLKNDHQYLIKMVKNEQEFATAFNDYQQIYQRSWKQQEFSFDFIEAVCRQALATNQLRMVLLYVGEKAVAAQLWFLQGKKASIFKLAYDENYKQYSVGSILSKAIFEHVIDIDNVNEIEYGTGDEVYKRDWMSKCRKRVIVDVYNTKTLRGKFLTYAKRIKQIISK